MDRIGKRRRTSKGVLHLSRRKNAVEEFIVDEERDAGKYKVLWDATRFSSGVYFLRLQAGDFVETKRLVLIR